MTLAANEEEPPSGCTCPGHAEGKHDLFCEHILRGAFGSVGDAPEDVKDLMRKRGRLVTGTVIAGEVEAGHDDECE